MKKYRKFLCRYRFIIIVPISFVILLFGHQSEISQARINADPATIFPTVRIGGGTGYGDEERDADIYPAVAYNACDQRYLAVWLSGRNAGSSSDGLDVFGVFLDITGEPVGDEFRISDDNTVARNWLPTVTARCGEFAVAWASRESTCRVYTQRVVDSNNLDDAIIASGSNHFHSPSLTFNSSSNKYMISFVNGDDYMPPSLFNADTDDCGNNISSTSNIQAKEYYFDDENEPVVTGAVIDITSNNTGAFRPSVSYNDQLSKYVVVWEDRRNDNDQPARLDVYAQLMQNNLSLSGENLQIDTGYDYDNYGSSTTWTPRPSTSSGTNGFLVSWYRKENNGNDIWSVKSKTISSNGNLGEPVTIANMSFAQSHTDDPPFGFLSSAAINAADEYLIGMTSHLESLGGFYSSLRVQRMDHENHLLKNDGTIRDQVSIGEILDIEKDDQLSLNITANPNSGSGTADYLAVYAKHMTSGSPYDFDIFSVRIQLPVQYAPPVAAFSAIPTTGDAPLEVDFTDQSTGDITSWSWSFGDGTTSNLQNPTHTYPNAGSYTVSLSVTGPGGGDEEAKNSYITITESSIIGVYIPFVSR